MRFKSRSVKIPTAESLAKGALFYLSRYAASEASLRRVLQNKIRRAAMMHTDFKQDAGLIERLEAEITHIIERHRRAGSLNDQAYAEGKILSLRRGGRSQRAIRQKLQERGIKQTIVQSALEIIEGDVHEESAEAEWRAVLVLAKKRRLGPFRVAKPDDDPVKLRQKDAATLARAGYGMDMIRRLMAAPTGEDEDFLQQEE